MASPTLSFDRRGVSALAKSLAAETGLPHAKALACIARAAGYADGNALMGSLKAAERAVDAAATASSASTSQGHADGRYPLAGLATAVPEAQAGGYLYTLHFPFISDDGDLGDCGLEEIAYHVTDGGAVGGYGEDYVLRRTPISRDDLGRLATRFGSTPDFFLCFADSEDEEDSDPT